MQANRNYPLRACWVSHVLPKVGALVCSFLVLAVSGCATLFDRKQHVIIQSDPAGSAQLYQDGAFVGVLPSVVKLKRQRQSLLESREEKVVKKHEIIGRYRWGQSLGANLVFGLFNPAAGLAGVAIDWISGAAWDFPSTVRIGERLEQMRPPGVILVLPMRASSETLSDLGTEKLLTIIAKRYPKATIVPPIDIQAQLDARGIDFRESSDPDPDMLAASPATHFVQSRWIESDALIEYRLSDIFGGSSEPASQTPAIVPTQYQTATFSSKLATWSLELLPNALEVGGANWTPSVTWFTQVNPSEYYAFVPAGKQGLLGSGIYVSVSSVDHSFLELRLRGRFRWASRLSFSQGTFDLQKIRRYANDQAEILSRSQIRTYGIMGAIGPEFGVQTYVGYFYLGLMGSVSTRYLECGNLCQENVWYPEIGARVEAGYAIGISQRWSFLAYSFSTSEQVWRKLIDVQNEPSLGETSSSSLGGGLSLIYYLPEMRDRLKRLVP